MSDNLNIDELLKDLGNLSPEPPPGVWEQVTGQVQAASQAAQATGHTATGGAATAAKTAVLGSKVFLISATLVASVAAFVGYLVYTAAPEPVKTHPAAITPPAPVVQERAHEPVTSEERSTATTAAPAAAFTTDAEKAPVIPPKRKDTAAPKRPVATGTTAASSPVPVSREPLPNHPAAGSPAATASQDGKKDQAAPEPAHSKKQPGETPEHQPEADTEEFTAPDITNVFSPNGDGINDEFFINIDNDILFDLKITDKKGNIVFESKDKHKHWNGTNMFSGRNCEAGLYVYAFRYQLKNMKASKTTQGTILLKLSE